MKRVTLFFRRALAGTVVASMLAQQAVASDVNATDRLAGTWSLVSLVAVQGDNSVDVFGTEPRGKMILTPGGHFSTLTTRASLPEFASNNRMQGTPQEYAAVMQGANAHYGTFEVDEANSLITFRVEVSTFPNWEGQTHERVFTLEGDELSYTNPNTTVGASSAQVVWKRVE
jgi:hypothetical protein